MHTCSRPCLCYDDHLFNNGQDGGGNNHCSKAPRTRKMHVMKKKNKWHENMYQCAANHNKGWLRFNKKKEWNTVIRLEKLVLCTCYNGKLCFASRTEIFNVMVYIFAQFAPYNLSTPKNEVANVL